MLDGDGRVDLIRAWSGAGRCWTAPSSGRCWSRTPPKGGGWPRSRPGTRSVPRCGCPRRPPGTGPGWRPRCAAGSRRRWRRWRLVASSTCRPRTWSPAVRELDETIAAALEARVLGRALGQTVAEFRRSVARAVIAADPASAADRHQKAAAARTIERMGRSLDGMESYWATTPASITRDVWAALTAEAKAEQAARQRVGLPDPGIDALRLDVLVHAVLHNGGADPTDPLLTTTGQHRTGPLPGKAGAPDAEVLVRWRPERRGGGRPGHPARAGGQPRGDPRLRTHPGPGGAGDGRGPGLGPGGPSTRPPGSCWTAAPGATGPRTSSGRYVADRDRICGFPGCNRSPKTATATTSSPSPTTARPSASTSDPSAGNTTTPKPTASGNSTTTPTPASRPGPAPSARPTPRPPTHP